MHPLLTSQVAFQDFVPCMVMCDSSMDALNERLDKPITCINFRPNLMIEGTKPFDEVSDGNIGECYNNIPRRAKLADFTFTELNYIPF